MLPSFLKLSKLGWEMFSVSSRSLEADLYTKDILELPASFMLRVPAALSPWLYSSRSALACALWSITICIPLFVFSIWGPDIADLSIFL